MEAERSQDSFPVYLKTELAEKFQKFRGHKHTTTQPNYHDEKYFDYTFEKDYFIEQKIIQKVHGCRSVVKCSNPKCKQRGWVERLEEPTRVRVIGDLQVGLCPTIVLILEFFKRRWPNQVDNLLLRTLEHISVLLP